MRDYLGSTRAVFDITPDYVEDLTEVILEQNDYCLFGSRIDNADLPTLAQNRFRFNGKEKLVAGANDTGLADYGARMFSAPLARWTTPDPLADKYYSISPYAFSGNNPVNYVDPDGRVYGDYYSYSGDFLLSDGIKDGKIYLTTERAVNNYHSNLLATPDNDYSIQMLRSSSQEVGGIIIQNREEETDTYTVSTFKTVGGEESVTGYILEPAGPSTAASNQNKRVPEGTYNIDNYSSEKYPSHFVLYNDTVSKNRAILYHAGNTSKDTRGCMLPGATYDGNGFIGDSSNKFKELKNFINSVGVRNIKVIVNNTIR